METISVNHQVAEELEADADLGSAGHDDFAAQIADQPIAFKVKDVFERLRQPEPEVCALYKMFEVWLVPHRFSLIRRSGLAEPVSVGLEIEYQHKGTTCSVISLLPGARWREHGKAAVATEIEGTIRVTGELTDDKAAAKAEGEPSNTKPAETLRLGNLGFGMKSNGQIGFSFNWSVGTPVVSAVGEGSSRCEWRFDRDREPLFGKSIETWSLLALPKRQTELVYKMRCYYLKRTLFFPTRREGEFTAVNCQLAKTLTISQP